MSNNFFQDNDDIAMIMKAILGEKELFITKIMFGEMTNKKSGFYKNISKKDPELHINDLLNAECALAMGVLKNGKTLTRAKELLGALEILVFSILRLRNFTLEEIENGVKEIQKRLRGERVYIESKNSTLADFYISVVDFLNEIYLMNNREIGERIGKSDDQVRRYLMKALEDDEAIFNDMFLEIREKIKIQHEKLLKRQGNRLFIRQGKFSKTYTVINLNKKIGEKGREYTASEKEVKNLLNEIKKVNKFKIKKE